MEDDQSLASEEPHSFSGKDGKGGTGHLGSQTLPSEQLCLGCFRYYRATQNLDHKGEFLCFKKARPVI